MRFHRIHTSRNAPRLKRGFTIVELLVMIAIISTLIGLVLPAVQQAREASRRIQCKNQMKQLVLALHGYHDTYQMFPYGFSNHEALWTAPILPFLEYQQLFDTLIFADLGPGSWNSIGPNRDACGTLIGVLRCPSMAVPQHITNQGIPGRVPVSYRGCAGSDVFSDDASTLPPSAPAGARALEQVPLNGMLWGLSFVRLSQVTDGTTNTIILGESLTDPTFIKDGQAMDYWQFGAPQIQGWVWGGIRGTEHSEALGSTGPRMNSRRDPTVHGVIMEMSFGSYHRSGATFALTDGSVRYLAETIDLDVYQGLGSRNGGEAVSVP